MTTVKRGFADVPHGQVHYRHAGEDTAAVPLVLFHASPGSARQLLGLIGDLAATRRVFAPDTPGNGDSPAITRDETTITRLALAMLDFLETAGLERVDLYGSHTGACIAAELAILAPDRVRAVVLDGMSAFTGDELDEVLTHYALPFEPDLNGAYIANLFQFCRDQFLFFPWYRRTRAGRRDAGMGSAADLHAWVTEVMKAHDTYHLNYRAAFRWNGFDRLPLLQRPALLLAGGSDPLADHTRALAGAVAQGRLHDLPRFDDPAFGPARLDAITAFLASAE